MLNVCILPRVNVFGLCICFFVVNTSALHAEKCCHLVAAPAAYASCLLDILSTVPDPQYLRTCFTINHRKKNLKRATAISSRGTALGICPNLENSTKIGRLNKKQSTSTTTISTTTTNSSYSTVVGRLCQWN